MTPPRNHGDADGLLAGARVHQCHDARRFVEHACPRSGRSTRPHPSPHPLSFSSPIAAFRHRCCPRLHHSILHRPNRITPCTSPPPHRSTPMESASPNSGLQPRGGQRPYCVWRWGAPGRYLRGGRRLPAEGCEMNAKDPTSPGAPRAPSSSSCTNWK